MNEVEFFVKSILLLKILCKYKRGENNKMKPFAPVTNFNNYRLMANCISFTAPPVSFATYIIILK
jgi:hypothetical protein